MESTTRRRRSIPPMPRASAHPKPATGKTPSKAPGQLRRLPLIPFALSCGHVGREYGVRAGDLLWCDACADQRTVARLLFRG